MPDSPSGMPKGLFINTPILETTVWQIYVPQKSSSFILQSYFPLVIRALFPERLNVAGSLFLARYGT